MSVGVPRVRSPLSMWWVKSARAKHPFLVGFFWLDLPVGGSWHGIIFGCKGKCQFRSHQPSTS
jgi:hypothetical protein